MGDSIVFVDGERIGEINDGGTRFFESEYLERYRRNLREIRERSAWKNEGAGAAFRGEARPPSPEPEDTRASFGGVDFLEDGRIVYSVSSADFSGIYSKRLADGNEPEGHVLHHARLEFGALACRPGGGELAVSVRTEGPERHIALINVADGRSKPLTEGDSVDDHPSWGKSGRRVYYSSAGIGRDLSGGIRGL